MGLDQYFVQSTADADVLNALESIIDINFGSGQIVEELTYFRGYRSLHAYMGGAIATRLKRGGFGGSVSDVTFFPAKKDKLLHLIRPGRSADEKGYYTYDSAYIPNTTFIQIYRDDLVPLIDFLRLQRRALKREDMAYEEDEYITVFYLGEGDYFIDELEVEGIYRQLNEVLDKMDDNLNLYYYAWF